ncbi:MAG: hypothetical protein APZ16_04535 [Candidatus Hadarchaeum yellowstonense]|uniref:Uncharacterized protein n=1 Tax=Hadarchaeum yellowstonense TaxID=1776334 RepID=A0A147JW22_HADYE|nr:MAG: hypothetical protein APZ16_04535 [Candidatus Hadarchaeum yellowstonense]
MPGPVKKVRGKMVYHRGKGVYSVYSPVRDRKIRAKHPSKPGYPQIGDLHRGRRRRGIIGKLVR